MDSADGQQSTEVAHSRDNPAIAVSRATPAIENSRDLPAVEDSRADLAVEDYVSRDLPAVVASRADPAVENSRVFPAVEDSRDNPAVETGTPEMTMTSPPAGGLGPPPTEPMITEQDLQTHDEHPPEPKSGGEQIEIISPEYSWSSMIPRVEILEDHQLSEPTGLRLPE